MYSIQRWHPGKSCKAGRGEHVGGSGDELKLSLYILKLLGLKTSWLENFWVENFAVLILFTQPPDWTLGVAPPPPYWGCPCKSQNQGVLLFYGEERRVALPPRPLGVVFRRPGEV